MHVPSDVLDALFTDYLAYLKSQHADTVSDDDGTRESEGHDDDQDTQ